MKKVAGSTIILAGLLTLVFALAPTVAWMQADDQAGAATATPAADAPTVDRVGFPENYQAEFEVFYEFDRPDNKTARVIYANPAAAAVTRTEYELASVEPGEPFPYGSILVMEVYRTQRDDAGNVVLDKNGRYVRDELSGVFVMRKEPGFGVKYGVQRNGEWEYTAYRPDGSVLVPPENTQACAACHVEASQGRDWIFGAHRAFNIEAPPLEENQINLSDYMFTPLTMTVKVGAEVTWVNNDVLIHTVTANDMSFNSGANRPGARFSYTFTEPGLYDYFCAIHPAMKGQIEVVE